MGRRHWIGGAAFNWILKLRLLLGWLVKLLVGVVDQALLGPRIVIHEPHVLVLRPAFLHLRVLSLELMLLLSLVSMLSRILSGGAASGRSVLLLLHDLLLLLLQLLLDLLLVSLVLGRSILPRLFLGLRDDFVRAAPLPLPVTFLLGLGRRVLCLGPLGGATLVLAALVRNLVTLVWRKNKS